tara:strand:- start:4451 stop:4936 length:486 start_codon:yes stop_codon:yes gene_type:complete
MRSQRSVKEEIEFGEAKELDTIGTIQEFLNTHYKKFGYCEALELTKSADEFAILDFSGRLERSSNKFDIFCELKSRRISSREYRETLIGTNKIEEINRQIDRNSECWVCLNFTDKIMIRKFELNEHFDTKWIKLYRDGRYTSKLHSLLPIDSFTTIIDKIE